MRNRDLDSMILMGPFQFEISFDSITYHSFVLWSKYFARQASTSNQHSYLHPVNVLLGGNVSQVFLNCVQTRLLWPGNIHITGQKKVSAKWHCFVVDSVVLKNELAS